MENIIFCGGCGSFISTDEISAGKASKINNIYYCLKCSTGQKITPVKPSAPSAPPTGSRPIIKPAQTTPPRGPTQAPVSPLRSNLSRQVANVSPKAVAPTPQKPQTVSNRPAPAAQARPSTIPVPKPTDQVTRRIPMEQARPTGPVTRRIEPPKPSTRFAMKPAPSNINFETSEEEAEARPPTRRFAQAQPAKSNMKKIYLIGGAVAAAVIITLMILSYMSNKAKEEEAARLLALAKSYYNEIVETARDFPDDPKKVLDKIKERYDQIKDTVYESEVKKIEATTKEQLDITRKFNALVNASIPTTKDEIDERIQEYRALKGKASDYQRIVDKINDAIKALTQEKQKIINDDKLAEEQLKKDWDDFKSKTDTMHTQKSYKDILKACEEFLGKPGHLKFQEETEKIKAEAQKALQEIDEIAKQRKEWQILTDDISKWVRSGASSSEVYCDEKNQLIMKNPANNPQGMTRLDNNNKGENWKDFSLTIEFKIVSGSLDMGVKGQELAFPRKFKVEWQKYTIEVKGEDMTISGTEMEPRTSKVATTPFPFVIVAKAGDEFIIKELKAKIIE
jgi:hypothetical protein